MGSGGFLGGVKILPGFLPGFFFFLKVYIPGTIVESILGMRLRRDDFFW